jgi:hypothetical protein
MCNRVTERTFDEAQTLIKSRARLCPVFAVNPSQLAPRPGFGLGGTCSHSNLHTNAVPNGIAAAKRYNSNRHFNMRRIGKMSYV